MKKLGLLFIFVLASLVACKSNQPLVIEAIDKELNEQLFTGKGLDTRLFSTKEKFQYYQVDNFKNLSAAELQEKLSGFVEQNYQFSSDTGFERLTFLFYPKEYFTDYQKYVYRAAQENDNGFISEYHDKLLALIILKKQSELSSLIRDVVIYGDDKVLYSKSDTVLLN